MSSRKVVIGVLSSLLVLFALGWFVGDWGSHYRISRDFAEAGVVPDLPPTPGRLLGWDLPHWWDGVGFVKPTLFTLVVGALIFFLPEEIMGVPVERWMISIALGGLAVLAALFGAWGKAVWLASALGGYLWFEHHPLGGWVHWPSKPGDPAATPPVDADPNPPWWSALVLFALGVVLL